MQWLIIYWGEIVWGKYDLSRIKIMIGINHNLKMLKV